MRKFILSIFTLFCLLLPALASAATSPGSLTGLWWNQSESGWGMSLTQQGSLVFVAWYTYDSTGKPVWLVMSSCPLVGSGCTGDIYDVKGGTPLELPWNGSGKVVTKVGTGSFQFADSNTGTFSYSVNGVAGAKNITRQLFATGSSPPATDYSALWWNENESGWGVAITQQYETMFAAIFTYDASGRPVWYVASNCAMSGNGCTGDLYRVTGGSAPSVSWSPNLAVTKVGAINFVFDNTCAATMTYTINGVATAKTIANQLPGVSQCAARTVAARAAPGVCAATLSQDLTLQIPKLIIAGSAYAATLNIAHVADGRYTTTVTSFAPTSRGDCSDVDTGIVVVSNSTYVLHIPSLKFGTAQYWTNFEYTSTPGETTSINGAAARFGGSGSSFKLTKYGNSATGVTGEGSAFLSLAQVAGKSAGSKAYQVKESLPGGTQANFVVTVLENQTYTPTAEETAFAALLGIDIYGAKFSYSETNDGARLLTQYFVPYSVLPAAGKSEPLQAAMPATNLARAAKSQKSAVSGIGVAIDVTLVGTGKQQLDNLASMGFGNAGRLAAEAGATTLGLYSAMWTDKDNPQPSLFGQLRACNPEAAARLMAGLPRDMARGEAADFVIKAITAGNYLVGRGEGGEGTETAQPFQPYAGQAIYAFKAASIPREEIEPLLAACRKSGYEVNWSGGGTRVWGAICNGLDRGFSLNYDTGGVITGTLAFSPSSASGGSVSLTGQATGGVITYTGGGAYTISGQMIVMSIAQQTAVVAVTGHVINVPGPSGTLPLLATDKCPS